MNFFSTSTLSKLPPLTKAEYNVSSIPHINVTTDDFYNDGIPSDQLLPLGTYIGVELDVRVETTTPKKIGRSGCQRIGGLKQKFIPVEPLQEFLIDTILKKCPGLNSGQ
ncbi:hypothetical protein H5410_052159 [Solanum commersonii]|uniref:Uncharacterized protein n=1 Tax=Solanum commersonii TaxID=4109 RepID=A0A9J5X2K9_SOLCO|nr:hypothetical protein H5410_052159 [Solanum commersonii]